MADNRYSTIINEPEVCGSRLPRHRHQRVDENGEVIIAEAICNRRRVCMQVCCFYYLLAVLSLFILSPILCFVGLFFGLKASSSWKLYLTSTGIHYNYVAVSTCCYKKVFIPLSDIEDVFVQENIVIHQQYGGAYASHAHSVKVRIDPSKIGQYQPWCQCLQSDYLEFVHVENASDFAASIKQQLNHQ